jgi:quercetin dioxygenase-like cupin family protein
MERRDFVQLSLLTSLITLKNKSILRDDDKKGFAVRSGKDRYQEELHIMGGQFDCKLSSKDTDGALLMYDTVRLTKGGPALHFHHAQDELFYIIKGEFTVKVGDDVFNLKAGDFAFAPRKIPHAFAKTSEAEGQMLVLFQPAGSMEDFFLQMAKLGKDIPNDWEKAMKELMTTHGMEMVGPPLKY